MPKNKSTWFMVGPMGVFQVTEMNCSASSAPPPNFLLKMMPQRKEVLQRDLSPDQARDGHTKKRGSDAWQIRDGFKHTYLLFKYLF